MEEKKPLSQFGVGPYYAAVSFVMTLTALLLNHYRLLPVIHLSAADLPIKLLGLVCLIVAAVLWCNAVITTKIARHIRQNELVTSGAYAWVRNPIYTAVMLLMWGLLFLSGNLLLLVLCPVYHAVMTVMVKQTEEKWLAERYGQVYSDYCSKVNRCIPWFPKDGWRK